MLIEERLEAARAHLAAGREDDAALLYEGVLDAAPTNRVALKELASLKLARGDVESAMRLASGAAARGADPEALAILAKTALAAEKPSVASAALEQALEIDPHHPLACVLKAELHARQGEYDAAEALLGTAIEGNPRNTDLLGALASFYASGGVHAPALDLVQQALAREPDRPELIALLGSVLARLGDHEKALPLFERAHLLQPGNPLVMTQLADTLCALGQLTEAHRVARRAIALFEAFLPAWISYVKIMALRGEANQALAAFGQVARRHPDRAAALLSLALSYRATGDADQALRMIGPLLAKPEALDPAKRAQATALARDCLLSLGRVDEVATALDGIDIGAMLGLPEGQAPQAEPSENNDEAVAHALRTAALVVDGSLSALETLVLLRFDPKRATAGGPTDVHCLSQLRDIVELVDHVTASHETPQSDRDGTRRGPLLPLSALLSLPPGLRGEIAAPVPYITAQGKRRDLWRRSLAELPRPLIALAWDAGRPGILLEDYRPFFDGFDGTLVAMAWDNARHQLATWPEVIDGGVHFRSLADLVAIIAEADAVIGPDGIPLHVAGAMGRPGMLLTMPDWPWYWHHEAGRSSWYPAITVLQSETFGNWAEKLPPLVPAMEAFLDGIARPPEPSRPGVADRAVAVASSEAG